MPHELSSFFINDHRRLELLLNQAAGSLDDIDDHWYSKFREGLLRHIGIEERILFPAIKSLQQGVPYAHAETLRKEHGALAALLVPPPDKKIITALQVILDQHNAREECENCLYHACGKLLGPDVDKIMIDVKKYPPVPVAPYMSSPHVLEATKRALARAGYDFDNLCGQENSIQKKSTNAKTTGERS